MTTKMPSRIVGALLPDTAVTLRVDGVPIDPAGYTWKVEAKTLTTPTTVLFTKTTGFTDGTSAGPTFTIAWTSADLGLLTAGNYLIELTGTIGSKPRKEQLTLRLDPEVV